MLLDAVVSDSGYQGLQVIWDVQVKVNKGETVLIIGPNGAGKTTFLKSIMGILKINEGKVQYKGTDITKVPLRLKQSLGILYLSEDTFFNSLTIKENLRMGSIFQTSEQARLKMKEVFEVFPELEERQKNKCSSLSGGQRKMLIMARAIMGDPELLVIDEPSGGLSPLFVDKIIDVLHLLKERGISILLSEQNIEFASLSDRIYVISNGRIPFSGTKEEALENDLVRKTYFSI